MVAIIVNARRIAVGKRREISYKELVQLAWPGTHFGVLYTVVYYTRLRKNVQMSGTLVPGQKIDVYQGMIFDVTVTSGA